MNYTNPMFSTPNPNSFGSFLSFGEASVNNSQNNQTQMNKIDLLKQPTSLRKPNNYSAFDNRGNLFTSARGIQIIHQNNQIETELINSFSVAFSKNLDQITITMNNSYKTFSQSIRRILVEKSQKSKDYLPYLIQFSVFDFFLVNSDTISYKFHIRDELIFRLFSPDINSFELFKPNDLSKISKSTTETQIHKITFLLLLCDFSQAIPLIQSLIDNIEKSQVNYIQTNFREYIDFFINVGRLCENYSRIISEISTINVNYTKIDMIIGAMIKETSQDMERILRGIRNDSINSSFNSSLGNILLLIKGDANTIAGIVNDNNLNWYFILLCHIYYRGYQPDFIKTLQHTINNLGFKQENHLEKDLINVINNCVTNQFEAIQGLKSKVPFVLYFTMLTILNDMELINQMDESIDIYKYEYNEFLNSLYNYDISLEVFIAYFYGYIDTNENSNMIFIHNFAVKKIDELFHKQISHEEIKSQIKSMKTSITGFQMMTDSLVIIHKICFNNYLRLNDYKECIQAYLDYTKLSNEGNDHNPGSSNKLISDPTLSERDDMFDVILSLVLNKDEQWESLSEVFSWLSEKKDLPANVAFLWCYIHFKLRIKREDENLNNVVNEFFGFCFVKKPFPGCPAMLWLVILNEIKEAVDINGLSLIKDQVAGALDNLLLYEDAIKRRMKQYWINKRNTIDGLFEEVTNFLFDLKTNMIE